MDMKSKATLNAVIAGALALVGFLLWNAYKPTLSYQTVEPVVSAVTVGDAPVILPLVSERVIALPEDGQRWHTVLVYTDKTANPNDRKLAAMMYTTPRLMSLLAQTSSHTYSPADEMYRSKYQSMLGSATPQIIIQRNDGLVVYKASGENLPATGEQLANEINVAIERIFPRPCPGPGPCPQPQPQPPVPAPQPNPSPIPDIRPEPPAPAPQPVPTPVVPAPVDPNQPAEEINLWVMFAIAGAAALAAFWLSMKQDTPK